MPPARLGIPAMPVTPEQNEEWLSAIPLLDYSDLHALTEKGLQQSAGRLIRGKVPSWAVLLREKLIANAWPYYSWVPDFALRSEVALIGLQLLYPDKFDAGQIYRNVRLRLIHEALRPFVEHTEQLTAQGKDVLRT